MTVYASKIELWRAAFPLVGEPSPPDASGTDDTAVAANALYEGVVRDALTKHAWSFAVLDAALTYEADLGTGRSRRYRYALPSNVLLPRYVELDGSLYKEGEIRGQKYFTNFQTSTGTDLRLFYTWRAPESQWPADFSDGVLHIFAGRLAKGVYEQAQKGEMYESIGERKLMNAKARDRYASGRTPRSTDDPLVKAWRGSTSPLVAPGVSSDRYVRGVIDSTGS